MPYHEQATFDELTAAGLTHEIPQEYPLEYLWGFLIVYGRDHMQSPEPPAYSVDETDWFEHMQDS